MSDLNGSGGDGDGFGVFLICLLFGCAAFYGLLVVVKMAHLMG